MGLGPNNSSIFERIAAKPLLGNDAYDDFIAGQQIIRSTARALGAMKRRQALVKLPKPRKHKHHCYCLGPETCCRCTGAKCVKPKPKPRVKKESTTKVSNQKTGG